MSTRHFGLLALITASILLAHRADGQGAAPGQRVRLMVSGSKRPLVVGQFIRQANDSIVIRPDSALRPEGERAFLLERGHRVEQSVGFRRRTLKGVGVGLLAGATTGGVVGALTYSKPDCSSDFICFDFGRGFSAFAGAMVLALPGMVIGGIIGASEKHEAWRRADPAVRALIAPTAKGGVQLAASMSF